ncbi:hypothetical protein OAF41_01015 [bacterium]|nr:hypothetical protein [bacterium]
MSKSLKLLFFFAPYLLHAAPLRYQPAPLDNPLKGLVPYASTWKKEEKFPHSMEFQYFAMGELMKGWGQYDWRVLEGALEKAKAGGRQLIFRIYLEYPGKDDVLPAFLLQEGIKVTRWAEESGKQVVTPDYESEMVRRAILDFIGALGKKYDGDPRVGFITAGILGLWGEWHNYPREDLEASKEVQLEVMQAFEKAFPKTRVLLRYPAGGNDGNYADNRKARFGYHDDSFAWATVPRAGKGDEWFFVPKLKKAGLTEKWKEHPIGGEIRPEIWSTVFTGKRKGQQQDFRKCVNATHVSWLMDSGMFSDGFPQNEERRKRASEEVSRMGYELHLSAVEFRNGEVKIKVENRGVAPFYYDWPVKLRAGEVVETGWKLSKVLPGEPVVWRAKIPDDGEVAIQVSNPMEGGRDLKFANQGYQDGWLQLR